MNGAITIPEAEQSLILAANLSTELRELRQVIADKLELHRPAVLDMKQAACYLSTTRKALYNLVTRGGIPCRRIGRKYVFPQADLDAWLRQLPGITVAQAIAAIKPEHRELWVKGSVRIRYEDPKPERPITLRRGPRGNNRQLLQAAKGID